MKKTYRYAASTLLVMTLAAGCNKSDQPAASTSNPPAGTTATPGGGAALPSMTTVTNTVKQDVKTVSDAASDPAKATVLLDEVESDIKNAKLADADSALQKVEAVKGNLPQTMQDRVTQLRTALDKTKAMTGGGMPAMPAMPGMNH